jgi:galactokinase
MEEKSENGKIDLFVPGRLCLFGEHHDWVGACRKQNHYIEKGYAIIAPTTQGTHARVRKLEEPIFRFISTLSEDPLEVRLEEERLLEIARSDSEFRYSAGVAHQMVSSFDHPSKIGLEIENYKTDLPIKKGLSSSASICVLTAEAFNKVFKRNLKPSAIMEYAYKGEYITGSSCGKMDQACAYRKPILMTFDGDMPVEIDELKVGEDMYLLIVDLNKGKDTVKILADLGRAFPWPNEENETEVRQHMYFGHLEDPRSKIPVGSINKDIVFRSIQALKEGDAERVGRLMREAQEKFDEYLAPACPEELTAPRLHEVLSHSPIQELIYGGKGVGSQGDGSAQLICKSREDREKAKQILESELEVECLDLDLKKNI